MKYKIAVCDDNAADRNYILDMINRWAKVSEREIVPDTFPSAESFLFHYAEKSDYEILLLDIEMGEMDGVTLAKKIRELATLYARI